MADRPTGAFTCFDNCVAGRLERHNLSERSAYYGARIYDEDTDPGRCSLIKRAIDIRARCTLEHFGESPILRYRECKERA